MIDLALMERLEAELRSLVAGETLMIGPDEAQNLISVLDNHPMGDFVRELEEMRTEYPRLEQRVLELEQEAYDAQTVLDAVLGQSWRSLPQGDARRLSRRLEALLPGAGAPLVAGARPETRSLIESALERVRSINPFEGGAAALLGARVKAMEYLEAALDGMGESGKAEP